jgi:hypothetical protein
MLLCSISFYKARTYVRTYFSMHKHAHLHTYVIFSNDFDLHKIRVMQNLQEQNDCVTRGPPVLDPPQKSQCLPFGMVKPMGLNSMASMSCSVA